MPFLGQINTFLNMVAQRKDLMFIVFIMIFVSMFIIPVPVLVIDILIAFNMTFTLLVLISATYLKNALELSTFPSIILFSTIFRLSLTVATARLILANGDAGKIIDTFGKFVVAGNLVIGLVVFFLVAIVQFIVVVKGAERIAEVSARFTLDALPGKQMSIDSDLRSGDITKDDARRKRQNLEKESQFFGAMDGAMRFVKGDAIAGFVVIFLNLIGGVAVGMAIKGMSFNAAINKYALLSVGDGLVAQIPAMFIAMAAGTVVTRVSTDDSSNIGTDMFRELGTQPKTLGVAAVVMGGMGFLPGFPTTLFFLLAAALGGGAYMINRAAKRVTKAASSGDGTGDGGGGFEDTTPSTPLRPADRGDTFVVVASPSLLQALEAQGGGSFLQERKQALQQELGMPMPEIGFRADMGFEEHAWRLDVEDVPTFKHEFYPDRVRVYATAEELGGKDVTVLSQPDPSGVPEVWVQQEDAAKLVQDGIQMAPPAAEFADVLLKQLRRNASRAFGLAEAQGWLQMLEARHGPLAQNVMQSMPLFRVVEVVRILLDEGVPLAQSRVILETLLTEGGPEVSPRELADRVRHNLRRQIASQLSDPAGNIRAVAIGPDVEELLRSPNTFGFGNASMPDPGPTLDKAAEHLRALLAQFPNNRPRVLVCSPDVRALFQEVVLDKGFDFTVLGTGDVPPGFNLQFAGVIQESGPVLAGAQAA